MRAAVHSRYGPPSVQQVTDVARPIPGEHEVLVRVHATTVNRSDTGYRGADPVVARFFTGLLRPKRQILGSEFAGVIEAVGGSVTHFEIGDEVFGVNATNHGAHAEFLRMTETAPIALKPSSLSFVEAAPACDGAILALTFLRRADTGPGQRMLIYGASGAIGTAAVQLAVHLGAHVTAVCGSDGVELVRSLGAHEVIDRAAVDFTRSGETYDVVFDAVGKLSFRRSRVSLVPDGRFLETDLGFGWQNPLWALWGRWFGRKKLLFPIPVYRQSDVVHLAELIDAGQYRPVIDRTYRLEEIVGATEYVETAQKLGNVVITVGSPA